MPHSCFEHMQIIYHIQICESCAKAVITKQFTEPNPPDFFFFKIFQADLLMPVKVAKLQLVHFPNNLRPMVASATDRLFFLSILSADLMDILPNIHPSYSRIWRWEPLRCLVLSLSSIFQLCLHFPDPRPTGLLKMQKVQGESMFNAWSCQPRSSELIPEQD